VDSAADVKAYDTVHEHILQLADTLTAGLANRPAASSVTMPSSMPKTGGGSMGSAGEGSAVRAMLALLAVLFGLVGLGSLGRAWRPGSRG